MGKSAQFQLSDTLLILHFAICSSFLFAVGGHVFGLACFWPSAIGPSVNRLANSSDKQAAVHAGAIGALVGEEAALYPLWATF